MKGNEKSRRQFQRLRPSSREIESRMKMFRFSNLSTRTHHSFLFVIPSEAEGSAVRPSHSRKPRVAALP
jgi:hypothetical protein